LKRREQQRPQRDDGYPGSAGKSGEKSTCRQGNDGQAGRHPAQQRLCEPDQAPRRPALAQQVTGEGKQRNREQDRHLCDAVKFDRDRLQVDTFLAESPHRAGGDDREQGRAQQGQQNQ
jgi:hypothetical protein